MKLATKYYSQITSSFFLNHQDLNHHWSIFGCTLSEVVVLSYLLVVLSVNFFPSCSWPLGRQVHCSQGYHLCSIKIADEAGLTCVSPSGNLLVSIELLNNSVKFLEINGKAILLQHEKAATFF